jgi:signal transduction histidine kinase
LAVALTAAGLVAVGVHPLERRAPARMPPLAAAVEVAAYRIATETMTNVARHAAAQHPARGTSRSPSSHATA